MKVVHICSYFTSSGLYPLLFSRLNAALESNDVYYFADNAAPPPAVADEFKMGTVIFSPCYPKAARLLFAWKHTLACRDAARKLDLDRYDLQHAHSLFSNGYVAHNLYKKYGTPYIAAVRATDIHVFFKRMPHLRRLGNRILSDARRIVFISPAYRDALLSTFAKGNAAMIAAKSIVLPNGIDPYWLNNIYRHPPLELGKTIRLIFAGAIDRRKNIEAAIAASDLLVDEGYEIEFTIAGRIADRRYKALIQSRSYINYVGRCDKAALCAHYRASDIFVMPSRRETFGLVYAEAMSQGLPVIYTRGEGFDGFFREGEIGYSVRCDDAQEIAERVKKIRADYPEISARCSENVKIFDWDVIARDYINLYADAVKISQ